MVSFDNILFVPSVPGSEWVSETFPDRSPAELPIAGRRIMDYGMEYAQRFGTVFTEILDWSYVEGLAKEFSDPARTGYPVFYFRGEGPLPKGLNSLEGISSPLTERIQDGLAVVWGPCLVSHPPERCKLEPLPEDECARTPLGIYVRSEGRWMRLTPAGLCVKDAWSWHCANFAVLDDPGDFTLPGYSAEPGVYLGRNVVMEHGTEVKKPVLLQDDTWCARNVQLDGDVIVGRGSYISEGARLKNTVVGSDTFIGAGVDLEGKIVIGRRVFDIATGAWVDIEEPGLAKSIGGGPRWLRRLFKIFAGHSFGGRG